MKYITRMLLVSMLIAGTTAIFASEPSIRLSFPEDGELVDCDGFLIVAHAVDVQRADGEDEVQLKSKVTIIENFVDDEPAPIEHTALVDHLAVVTSDDQIEAIKPDAKDMLIKLYKPRRVPLVTSFECTDSDFLERIDIMIEFNRAGTNLPMVSVSVEPEAS